MVATPATPITILEKALQQIHKIVDDALPGIDVERDRLEPYAPRGGIAVSVQTGDAPANSQEGQQSSSCRLTWNQGVLIQIYCPRDGMPQVDGEPRSMVPTSDPFVATIYSAVMGARNQRGLWKDITPQRISRVVSDKAGEAIYTNMEFIIEVMTAFSDLTTTQ